jgi:hypothetical protein
VTPLSRRLATVGIVILATLVLGVLARMPAPSGSRLEIDTAADPPPPRIRSVRPQSIARLIDPETLENVPGAFLPVEEDGWAFPSDDGRLLALVSGDRIRVVERETFGVVASLDLVSEGPAQFTPEADGLFSWRDQAGADVLALQPLAADARATVALPPGLQIHEAVPLRGGRAAALTLDGDTARLLVADMVAGTVVRDVPLPGVVIVSSSPPTTRESGETPILRMAWPPGRSSRRPTSARPSRGPPCCSPRRPTPAARTGRARPSGRRSVPTAAAST